MAKGAEIKKEIIKQLGIPESWINKYSMVTVFFLVWMIFFDKHNVFSNVKLQKAVAALEQEKVAIKGEISQAINDRKDLHFDQEKFAKEKHLMHLPNEEIIIIETDKK